MAAQAIQAAARALRVVGFVITPKSKVEPTTDITFIGKRLNSVTRSISNTTEIRAVLKDPEIFFLLRTALKDSP